MRAGFAKRRGRSAAPFLQCSIDSRRINRYTFTRFAKCSRSTSMNRRNFIRTSIAAACVVQLGSVFADAPHAHHFPMHVGPKCPHCHGSGRVRRYWFGFTKECPVCHGRGHLPIPPPKPAPRPVPKPAPRPAPSPAPHRGGGYNGGAHSHPHNQDRGGYSKGAHDRRGLPDGDKRRP